jgi:ComF family protein
MLGHFVTRLVTRLAVPGVCGLCGGGGQWDRCPGGLDLCEHCEAALPAAFQDPGAGPPCHAAFDYRPPADFMIRQLKFAGDRSFARTLGLLLAERRRAVDAPLPELLVPVPLHLDRLRERGFNQAEELARFAGRRLGLQVAPRLLVRTRATVAQSGLPAAARAGNVRDCFSVAGAAAAGRLKGRAVALVDDVLTTGNTTREAARVLAEGGATSVEVWVACRAGVRAPKKKGGGLCSPPPLPHA